MGYIKEQRPILMHRQPFPDNLNWTLSVHRNNILKSYDKVVIVKLGSEYQLEYQNVQGRDPNVPQCQAPLK
jgi:hypothetical protein